MPRKAAKKTETKKTPTRAVVSKETTTSSSSSAAPQRVRINPRNPRLWIGVGVVVLAILLFVFRGLFIAATVNGQPISRLAVIQQLEKQSGKDAVSSLVTQTLIVQEAQKEHVTVSQSEVNDQIKKIEDSLKGQGVTLDQALAARGLSRDDLIKQITLQAMVDKMVGKDVKVTDQQVQDYIDKNQDSLPKDLSADQLKAQVRQQLEQQALSQKTQDWVNSLQKKANITYFVNY